jgi:hypothetical protein
MNISRKNTLKHCLARHLPYLLFFPILENDLLLLQFHIGGSHKKFQMKYLVATTTGLDVLLCRLLKSLFSSGKVD